MTSPPACKKHADPAAAASRKKFLNLLKSLQECGPVSLYLHDNQEPRIASSIAAFAPDSSAYVVRDLQTPLGTVPTAIIRGSDTVRIAIDVSKAI